MYAPISYRSTTCPSWPPPVKCRVQWRWPHRQKGNVLSGPSHNTFDDLDVLMDVATDTGLKVTVNTVFDITPTGPYDLLPDTIQVMPTVRWSSPRALHTDRSAAIGAEL